MDGAAAAPRTARAKINLSLHVGLRRADGFHPLQSLVVFTDAGDVLTAEPDESLSCSLEGPFAAGLTHERDNLVLRSARALAEAAGIEPHARLKLTKNLPVSSGIGGGSADAAAALESLVALWGLNLGAERMMTIAAGLGSDIPVCLAGLPTFMEGRGEILTPVASFPHLPLLLVNPGVAVPTRDVFAAVETRSGVEMEKPLGRFRDCADVLRYLETTKNDLQAPALVMQPVIGTVLSALAALPGTLFARMSGSGATCFAIFPDQDACLRAAAALKALYPAWWILPTFVPAYRL